MQAPRDTAQVGARGSESQHSVVRLPSRATADPTPSVSSMRKKSTAKACGATSNLAMASGYETNASPDPPLTTDSTGRPASCARLPRMPKMVQPASMLVSVSMDVTMSASLRAGRTCQHSAGTAAPPPRRAPADARIGHPHRTPARKGPDCLRSGRFARTYLWMLWSKALYDDIMTIEPKPTPSEKKHCVTAAYHTWNRSPSQRRSRRWREQQSARGPHTYLGVEQAREVGPHEEDDAVHGAGQRDAPHEQHEEDDVGEEREEVGRLARGAHAAARDGPDGQPGGGQAQRQRPARRPNAARNAHRVVRLAQHLVPAAEAPSVVSVRGRPARPETHLETHLK